MDCVAAFIKRCEVAKTLIESAVEPGRTAENQQQVILGMVRSAQNSRNQNQIGQHLDRAIAAVLDIKLEPRLQQEVLDELALMTPSTSATWRMQDYRCVWQYFTDDEWAELNDPNIWPSKVEVIIFNRATELGCRKPSEPTTHAWTSFLVLRTYGFQQALRLSCAALQQEHSRVKKAFRTFSLKMLPPEEEVLVLPSAPAEMKHKHEGMYNMTFTDKIPTVAKCDLRQIMSIGGLFKCRGQSVMKENFGGSTTAQPGQPVQHLLQQLASALQGSMLPLAFGANLQPAALPAVPPLAAPQAALAQTAQGNLLKNPPPRGEPATPSKGATGDDAASDIVVDPDPDANGDDADGDNLEALLKPEVWPSNDHDVCKTIFIFCRCGLASV